MGFYLRKAIRVGPLRFNLSKSGIGISAGIPGFRIGMGPRGNYIHAGRGGLYFRKTLGGSPTRPGAPSPLPAPYEPRPTATPLQEIESASVVELTDSSGSDLLAELDRKRRLVSFLPMVIVAAVIVIVGAVATAAPSWAIAAIAAVAVVGAWYAHQRDQLRKTTVVFYDLDPELEQAYDALHTAFSGLQRCAASWHIEARGDVLDRKYHAGASQLIKRTGIALRAGEPPFLKTNVLVPIIPAGRQTLALLPDRILVFDAGGVGAVPYGDLSAVVSETQFVEDASPPPDATVVGSTWRYVNKKGGPDRRFGHNPELPIMRYAQVGLTSPSGLNELFQFSTVDAPKTFGVSLERLAACTTAGGDTHPSRPVA